jgi:beta-phosphoglucomutase-like phosphatase (HAD superfamily)
MDKKSVVGTSSHQRGVLVEADLVVLAGTELFFQACTARLDQEGIKLDRSLFMRFLFGKSLTRGMTALLEKMGKSTDGAAALASECMEAYLTALQAAGGKARDSVLAFVKDVAERGVKVGLMTQLPEAVAKDLFAEVLGNPQVQVIPEPAHHACVHGWEGWRRAARKLQVGERLCVAIASPASSRGALAAAMRLVIVQDPLQDHFDCGGADLVVESLTPAVRTAALRLLKIEEGR